MMSQCDEEMASLTVLMSVCIRLHMHNNSAGRSVVLWVLCTFTLTPVVFLVSTSTNCVSGKEYTPAHFVGFAHDRLLDSFTRGWIYRLLTDTSYFMCKHVVRFVE